MTLHQDFFELVSLTKLYLIQEHSVQLKPANPQTHKPAKIASKPTPAPIPTQPTATIAKPASKPAPIVPIKPPAPIILEQEQKPEKVSFEYEDFNDIRKILSEKFPAQKILDVVPSSFEKIKFLIIADEQHPFLVSLYRALHIYFSKAVKIIDAHHFDWQMIAKQDKKDLLIIGSEKWMSSVPEMLRPSFYQLQPLHTYMKQPELKAILWNDLQKLNAKT